MKIKKHGFSAYSLSDLVCRIFWLVMVLGLIRWVEKGFILTYISMLFLIVILHQLMKSTQISHLNKLPIFIFAINGFIQRAGFLIEDPDNYTFDFSMNLTDEVLASTIAYVAITLLILWCFLGLQYFFRKGRLVPVQNVLRTPSSNKLIFFAAGYYALSLIINGYLGIYHSVGLQGGEPSPLGYLVRIFDIDQAFVLVMMLYVYYVGVLSKKQQYFISMLIFISVLFTVFRGSRSAIFGVVFVAWFAAVAKNPSFLIQKKHLITASIVLIGIGFPLFVIALAFRSVHVQQEVFDPIGMMQSLSVFSLFQTVSTRLGELDALSAVLFKLQLQNYDQYVTIIGTLDSILKGLLPSFLYTQSIYSIDQVFPYVFKGIPLETLHGEHWTGLGVFIAYTNVFLAPFCLAFFMFLCIKIGEKLPMWVKNDHISYVLQTNFAYSYFLPIILTGSFSSMSSGFIRFLIIFYGIWIGSRMTFASSNYRMKNRSFV